MLNSPGYPGRPQPGPQGRRAPRPAATGSIEGTGFVYAPDHVLTNAHVVAGVPDRSPGDHPGTGTSYQAQVVLYDPQIDIAVLYVPGLDLPPLSFGDRRSAGASAVVAGYPLDHGVHRAGRADRRDPVAVGADIYQTGQVDRQIYEIRANVQPGNSAGR